MNELLLVIDFINDIVHPEGKRSSCANSVRENNVIQCANEKIQHARNNLIPVAHVKVGFSSTYVECPEHSPVFASAKQSRALELGTWGTAFHEDLDVRSEDIIIVKHRISAYYATNLAAVLQAQRIQRVLICGVSTNMAIESTARELHDRDYAVTICAKACAAANEELHLHSLNSLSRIAEIEQ